MKKKNDVEEKVAQIEKEFSQIDIKRIRTEMFDLVNRKWIPREGPLWDDDVVLRCCIYKYEEALKEGATSGEACGRVMSFALAAVEKGLWRKVNYFLLWEAIDTDSRTPWRITLERMVNPDMIRGRKFKRQSGGKRFDALRRVTVETFTRFKNDYNREPTAQELLKALPLNGAVQEIIKEDGIIHWINDRGMEKETTFKTFKNSLSGLKKGITKKMKKVKK